MSATLRIRRLDTGKELDADLSAIRFWLEGYASVRFGVTRDFEHRLRGDVAYLRQRPGSPWCVPCEVLPLRPAVSLKEAFRRILGVMPSEVEA